MLLPEIENLSFCLSLGMSISFCFRSESLLSGGLLIGQKYVFGSADYLTLLAKIYMVDRYIGPLFYCPATSCIKDKIGI